MTGPVIVLLDPDGRWCAEVCECFAANGVMVVPANAPQAVTDLLAMLRPRLLLLGVPARYDLLVLCAEVEQWASVPILLLLDAQPNDDIRVLLEAGADDYLRSPFSCATLRARMVDLVRRVASGSDVLEVGSGELTLHPQTQTVQVRGRRVTLTSTEYELLLRLAQQAGTVLTFLELLAGDDPLYANDPSYLAAYVWHLRQKLERNPRNPQLLLTIKGVGYLLVA